MGSTSTHKPEGMTVVEFLHNLFKHEPNHKLLKTAKIGNTVYCAIQCLIDQSVHAEVALIHLDKKEYHNINYKWIHEDMGPFYHVCPKSIMKLLTQRDSVNSKVWRAKVAEYHKAQKEANLRAKGMNNLPVGTNLNLYGKVYKVIGKTYNNKRYQVVLNNTVYNLRQSQLKHCTIVTEEESIAA